MNRNHANPTGPDAGSSIWVLADAETVRSVRTAFRGRPFAQLSLVAADASAAQAMPYTEFALRSTPAPAKAK